MIYVFHETILLIFGKADSQFDSRPSVCVVIYSHAIYACHKETGFQAYIEKQVLLCYYKLNIIYRKKKKTDGCGLKKECSNTI